MIVIPDRRTVFTGALLFCTAALIVAGLVYLLFRLKTILVWLVLAAILASGLTPLVDRLEGRPGKPRRLRRPAAAVLVFLGLVAGAAGLITIVAVPAARQVALFLG